ILLVALVLVVCMVCGSAYVGYLMVSRRDREVLPLNLKLLVLSMAFGLPSVWFFGAAGWFATLALTHVVVGAFGFKALRNESRRFQAPVPQKQARSPGLYQER